MQSYMTNDQIILKEKLNMFLYLTNAHVIYNL